MSVQEISKKAGDFDFNDSIPLKYWLRTADTLLREVSGIVYLVITVFDNLIGACIRARAQ